ncbi:MAG TPA: helix-turn-helix transcriptional regulator [Streptomyces sp.]|jgi:hypothetical protein
MSSSTLRLRRLSQELVRLRKTAGLTVEEVTKRLDWSTGRLTFIERRKWVRADVGNVARLLDVYGVTGAERAELLELARRSREKDWWADYKDLFPAKLPGVEGAAAVIQTFEPQFVPGLLQIREYAQAVLMGGQVLDPSSVARRVDARMERQQILTRDDPPAPHLFAVIDEAALLRMVGGPKIMHAQLGHLIQVAAWESVTIHVLKLSTGAHAAANGGFAILHFAADDDPPAVYIEGVTAAQWMERPEDVRSYTRTFNHVATAAQTPEESVAYMSELRDKLKE